MSSILVNSVHNSEIPGGTSLDTTNNIPKVYSAQFDVTQVTVFTGGTSGLVAVPFASWFKLMGPTNPSYFTDPTFTIPFEISTTFSNPFLNVQVIFANLVKVEGFGGFILLFNPASVTSGVLKGWKIGHLIVPFQINQTGLTFTMSTAASAYGPSFHPKCFLGFHKYSYKGQNTF